MAILLGLEYEGIPSGPSAGAINGTNIELIRQNLDSILVSPAGLAYWASIGSRRNEGNRGVTYFHDAATGETLNSMGLPEIGIDQAEPLIKEYSQRFADAGKILIVGATTLRGEDATKVLPELMERIFEAGGVVGEANYSCPNIVTLGGGRKPILGYDPEAVYLARSSIVAAVGKDVKIQEKLPPYIGEYRALIPEVAGSYSPERRLGNVGVTGFNTIPNTVIERDGKPVLNIEAEVDGEVVVTHAGGLSGPAVAEQYNELQREFLRYLPSDVPFMRAGGIWSGQDVRICTEGETRAEAATGVTRFWEGAKAGATFGRVATRMAEEYLEAS